MVMMREGNDFVHVTTCPAFSIAHMLTSQIKCQ
jgi:hypothetical protein